MSEKFWNKFADRYARMPIKDQASYDKKLRLIRGLVSTQSRVLEIGCGTGGVAVALAPDVKEIVAIDSSQKMLAHARAKARDIANIRFVQADFTQLPDAGFDVVLALSILHLLPNWRDAIRDVYARLPCGGTFVSNTVCIDKGSWKLRLLLPLGGRLGIMPTLQLFSQTELETTLREAGFDIEKAWNPGGGKTAFIIARKPLHS